MERLAKVALCCACMFVPGRDAGEAFRHGARSAGVHLDYSIAGLARSTTDGASVTMLAEVKFGVDTGYRFVELGLAPTLTHWSLAREPALPMVRQNGSGRS